MKINGLKSQRYYGVNFNNVSKSLSVSAITSFNLPELLMPNPYSTLVEKIKTHFAVDSNVKDSAVQQFRNHMSALNGFLTFCGKTTEGNVGIELSSQFDVKLRAFLDQIDVAPRTLRDRASQLRTIKRIYDQSSPVSPPSSSVGELAEVLRREVAQLGLPSKTLAKQAGVDPTTLIRWIAGANPRPDTMPALRRLESHLGLPRDSLVALVEKKPGVPHATVNALAYRVRHAERSRRGLGYSESELSSSFLAEWRAFFDYKVSSFPSLNRHAKGQWRLIPKSTAGSYGKNAERGSMVCPTAALVLEKLRSFLGVVLRLPLEEGGLGWYEAPVQTLAFCAHPAALECYLQWLSDRSDGLRHNGHRVFAQTIAALVRPETGYLWQQSTLFKGRLPEKWRVHTDDEWKAMCERSHKFLRGYIRTATETSRPPVEPIENLLALDEPFEPIFSAIDKMQEAAANSPPGGMAQARHKRDALLIALLLSNPLRIRSVASLTWLPNGQGSVRGSPSAGWRIVLQPAQLKNGGSKGGRAYDVRIADWVKPLLEEYIEEYRNTLLDGLESDYLFAGHREGKLWEGFSQRVLKLTRRYIPGSPGFGPHAFRHLVATVWLRKNPGDFLTVAELLNDNLATVLANYAHLRRDDSFARYEAQVNARRR